MTTATEIKTVAGMEKIIDAEVKGKLLQFGLYCQKEGLAECTGNTFVTAIRSISRHGNINDPESVKEALAKNMKISENTKFL